MANQSRATALLVELLQIQGDIQSSVEFAEMILNDTDLSVAQETDVYGWVSVIKESISDTPGGYSSLITSYRPLPLLPDCKWEGKATLP